MSELPADLPPEMRERNINLFELYIELENARDYENMKKIMHPTDFCSRTYFGADPISPEAHVRMLKGLFVSFPDWFMTIEEILIETSEVVVGRITGRGTQVKEFYGRPPNEHQIAIPTIHAIKIRDGFIVEHRHSNPFDNPFEADVLTTITNDVQGVRAQQGYDSEAARWAYDVAIKAGADDSQMQELKTRIDFGKNLCQVLLRDTMRRCSRQAFAGSDYCEHHMSHGYGIDDVDETAPPRVTTGA